MFLFLHLSIPPGGDSDGGCGSVADISVLGPGVYGSTPDPLGPGQSAVYMERMSTDITALQRQYEKLRQRQTQAHVIISGQLPCQHIRIVGDSFYWACSY